jgi:hypothetical protein
MGAGHGYYVSPGGDRELEVQLGPAPCHDCHLPLFLIAGEWKERHYEDRRGSLHRVYRDHHCTAREGNPVVFVIPKGRQGRGGHWRGLVGLPRTRRAPAGHPELV